MSLPDDPATHPMRRFWGGVLIAIGGLITALCGTCTVFFVGASIWGAIAATIGQSAAGTSYDQSWAGAIAIVALIVGGVPTAIGGLMLFFGIRLVRRRPRQPGA